MSATTTTTSYLLAGSKLPLNPAWQPAQPAARLTANAAGASRRALSSDLTEVPGRGAEIACAIILALSFLSAIAQCAAQIVQF